MKGQSAPDGKLADPRRTMLLLACRATSEGWRIVAAQNTDIVPGAETMVAADGDLSPTRYVKYGNLMRGDHMPGEYSIDPTRPQFEAFKALPRDQPVEMLNLVRFKETAAYPADHPRASETLTGGDAYALYGKESAPVFARVGGKIIWRGHFQTVLIGPETERWDECFIARYPTGAAFLEMITDPAYQKAVVNRQAAVLTSRLIRHAPAEGGDAFG